MSLKQFSANESFEEKGIPATLQKAIELQTAGQAPDEPAAEPFANKDDYGHIRNKILHLIEQTSAKNPHHNAGHTREIETRFLEMAKHSTLSGASREWGGLRALLHDLGHCGQTLRQTAASGIKRQDLSNEEFAALRAHTLFSHNFSPEQITYLQTGILATSIGQAQGEYMRPYRPISDSEKLLAFADIAGFSKGFDEWMEESLRVLEEASRESIPENFETYLTGRKSFLKYCSTKLQDIEHVLEPLYYTKLKDQLDDLLEILSGKKDKNRFEPYVQEFELIRASKMA